MRRFLPLIALGCGAYLAFVVSTFPAAAALRWFAPDEVRAMNVAGTIWSGSARLASISGLALRDLRWEIDAAPLLLARFTGSAQANLPDGFANASFSAAGNRLRLSGVQLSTSISMLGTVLPVSGASGALSAQLDLLEVEDQWPVNAAGTVRVSDLLVEPLPGLGNQLLPLGSFEIIFTPGSDAGINAAIRDLGGPLEVEASLRLTPAREYTVDGTVRERASAPESLVQGLSFMTGEPGPDGRRAITFTGSL